MLLQILYKSFYIISCGSFLNIILAQHCLHDLVHGGLALQLLPQQACTLPRRCWKKFVPRG